MFISILTFSFLHFTSNGINPGARKLILNFNFHYWMKIKWTKGTRTFHDLVTWLVFYANLMKMLNCYNIPLSSNHDKLDDTKAGVTT